MADLRIVPGVANPTRLTADSGGFMAARGTRDGALFVADWKQALVMEGRGYHVTIGAFSTGITGGGAGTIFDQDQPEGIISVPSGVAILPLRIHIQGQVPLLATDADEAEALIAVDRLAAWPGDGTVTTETVFNLRTDNPRASSCSAASAATANITNPTLGIELARVVVTGDIQSAVGTTWGLLDLLYEPETPPIIMGPAAVYLYWGGTVAVPGFAEAQWLELPATAFS
jgi:hypothetical protein